MIRTLGQTIRRTIPVQCRRGLADRRGMLDFIIGYRPDSRSAGRAAVWGETTAITEATRQLERVEDLDERFDKLLYIVRAIWGIMEEQGLTSDDLITKIQELDISDEIQNRTARHSAKVCVSCESIVPAGRADCQVCGTAVAEDNTDHSDDS